MSSSNTLATRAQPCQLEVRVRQKREIAARIVSIEIDSGTGPLPAWTPGAHIDIATAAGWRSYSLCGRPEVLHRTGLRLRVGVNDTVLDVIENAGMEMLWSCRQGKCGSCEVPVISGEPDHRDEVLSPEERAANGSMMICESRSFTAELVLDV